MIVDGAVSQTMHPYYITPVDGHQDHSTLWGKTKQIPSLAWRDLEKTHGESHHLHNHCRAIWIGDQVTVESKLKYLNCQILTNLFSQNALSIVFIILRPTILSPEKSRIQGHVKVLSFGTPQALKHNCFVQQRWKHKWRLNQWCHLTLLGWS